MGFLGFFALVLSTFEGYISILCFFIILFFITQFWLHMETELMKNEDHFTHLSIPSQSLLPIIDILETFAE